MDAHQLVVYQPGARVNWGRWIVDCASPFCRSGMTLGDDRPDRTGRVWPGLRIGDTTMTCRDCGFVTGGIAWPADPQAIELILSWRPDETTQNWEPGETLTGLLRENVEHGIPIPGADQLPVGEVNLLTEIDGVATGGYIADMLTQLAGADARPQIGA